jgi:hypothetical protein
MTSQERLLTTPSLILAVTLAASMVAAPVLAASPRFIDTPKIVKNPNFSLTAKFRAADLSNSVTGLLLRSSGGTALLPTRLR